MTGGKILAKGIEAFAATAMKGGELIVEGNAATISALPIAATGEACPEAGFSSKVVPGQIWACI